MAFRFIDLFAGIGGMRLAAEDAGGHCVFSSEINPAARRTYAANFGDEPAGDITQIPSSEIPRHDVIFAGFPCQAFSKGGRGLGFEDARGTLFFEVARIARDLEPETLILENVKGLIQHDGGRTLSVILETLEGLGYAVSWRLLNANQFGLAQSRERIIIVARRGEAFEFSSVASRAERVRLFQVLDNQGDFEILRQSEYTLLDPDLVKEARGSGLVFRGYRNKAMRKNGVREGSEHLSRTHKQPNRIYSSSGLHPTLSAQESSGRYFVHHRGEVRKLTIRECYRLQGFPERFVRIGSYSDQQRQIGNSIPVNMVREVAKEVMVRPSELLLAA